MSNSLRELAQALKISPVMGHYHPLVPLCLQRNVRVVDMPMTVLEELDALEPHAEKPLLIKTFVPQYQHRFQRYDCLECPPATIVSQALPQRLPEARQWLLTNHQVANRIVKEVEERHYQTVILLLVDGLSYADVSHWSELVEPCFIDGPSITYSHTPNHEIDPQVGFPAIVGTPPLATRLVQVGLSRARGYSYWEREQNDVSAKLFAGMPLEKISHFDDALRQLNKMDLKGMYVQILRIGLDNLAHGSREVGQSEIQATVEAIHQDLQFLVNLLKQQAIFGAVYLMADHGILWKHNHDLQPIADGGREHARYLAVPQGQTFAKPQNSTQFSTAYQNFYVYHYPYYDRQIKSNDSGVHGGLSFDESIVPFIRVEVSP